MFKAIGRIGKDRIKFIVNFSALGLTLTCQEDTYIKLQVARGDQKPEDLPLIRVRASRSQQQVSFPRNQTPFECSYFVKDGVPDPKLAKLTFYATDERGRGNFVLTSLEINFSMHFGSGFEQVQPELSPSPAAHARGILINSVAYKANITPKKDKDKAALQECITWRQRTEESEQQKRKLAEERKKIEAMRKKIDVEEKKRQSVIMQSNEPIKGLGAFKQKMDTVPAQQKRTTSATPAFLEQIINQKQTRTQSVAAAQPMQSQQVLTQKQQAHKTAAMVNSLSQTQMVMDVDSGTKAEQRRSQNRVAVTTDLRASTGLERSAVRDDLRSNDGRASLDPTYEQSGDDSGSDSDDPFSNLLTERGKSQAQRTIVQAQKRPSRMVGAAEETKDGPSDRTRSEMIAPAAMASTALAAAAASEAAERQKAEQEEAERVRLEGVAIAAASAEKLRIEKEQEEERQKAEQEEAERVRLEGVAIAAASAEKLRIEKEEEEERQKAEKEEAERVRLEKEAVAVAAAATAEKLRLEKEEEEERQKTEQEEAERVKLEEESVAVAAAEKVRKEKEEVEKQQKAEQEEAERVRLEGVAIAIAAAAAEKLRIEKEEEEERQKTEQEEVERVRLEKEAVAVAAAATADKLRLEKEEEERREEAATEEERLAREAGEAEQENEIVELKAQIQEIEAEQSKAIEEKKNSIETQLAEIQAEIDAQKREFKEQLDASEAEKSEVVKGVALTQAQVNQQLSSIENLEFEVIEPREKLFEADEELEVAKHEHAETIKDNEALEKSLAEGRAVFEVESAKVEKEIAEVAELERQLATTEAQLSEDVSQIELKQEQINGVEQLIAGMEAEAENTQNMIYETDEKLAIGGNQEVIDVTGEASRLRHLRMELTKEKEEMDRDAVKMGEKTASLVKEIAGSEQKLKNTVAYDSEVAGVIENSESEAAKYRIIIQEQEEEKLKEAERKKELDMHRAKILAKKKRQRQKSKQFELEQEAEHQRTQSQARLDAELIRAASEIEQQFVEQENSVDSQAIIDNSQIVTENENEESVIITDNNELLQELQGDSNQVAQFGDNDEQLNQSRLSYRGGNDASFFSGGQPLGESYVNKSRASMDENDMDTGSVFLFDDLMRERINRDSIRASEIAPGLTNQNPQYDVDEKVTMIDTIEDSTSLDNEQANNTEVVVEVAQHFQTPVKESSSTEYFAGETDQSVKQQLTAQAEPAANLDSQDGKSLTEPSQLTGTVHRVDVDETSQSAIDKEEPDWLKYQEQNSSSQDTPLKKPQEFEELKNLGDSQAVTAEQEQIATAAVEVKDDDSAYDSFHSDEMAAETAPEVKDVDPKKEKWLKKGLTAIMEERADSVASALSNSSDETEVKRVVETSAVVSGMALGTAAGLQAKTQAEAARSRDDNVIVPTAAEGTFGAVGPSDQVEKLGMASAGSVQVAKEEENQKSDEQSPVEEKQRSSSWDIRQKLLLATTPNSKQRAIEELTVELDLLNGEIKQLQKLSPDSRSPERSHSQSSSTAVPIANPSNKSVLEEKFKLKVQIQNGLRTLQERERKEQERHQMFGTMSAMHNSNMIKEESPVKVDPYAPPSGKSTFIGAASASDSFISTNSRNSRSRFSSFTSSSQNRSSSRGSLYRATLYDRQAQPAGKSRRQTFTDMAMRDIYFMTVSKRHFFAALSDYEVMEGFNQFETMLKMDKDCHEAMFGLGKLNFLIKRYELAERWFDAAFAKKRDYVYRAWLGFTYVQLYEAMASDNPRRMKYLGYAVRNLTRCSKEKDLIAYTLTVLLYLSVRVTGGTSSTQLIQSDLKSNCDLQEPEAYLNLLLASTPRDSMEGKLAKAYLQLNTPGQHTSGVNLLTQLCSADSTRTEPFLALIDHYANKKQLSQEKATIDEALQKCSNFHSYPERLTLTLLKVKSLVKSRAIQDHLEAGEILQLQYTRTPHFASTLLYAYGKTIIECRIRDMIPNAISALEEAQRCAVSKRVHNCFAYIAKGFHLLQEYPLHACMHALHFREGAKQLTHRVEPVAQTKKEAMIGEILTSQGLIDNTKGMYDIVMAVKEAAMASDQSSGATTPRYSSITFIETPRRARMSGSSSNAMSARPSTSGTSSLRLNTMTSPLAKLTVKKAEQKPFELQLPQDPLAQIQQLTNLTNRFEETRDQLIGQGLIIRGLQDSFNEAHFGLLADLIRHKREIKQTNDIQLQTLLVRSLRKSKQVDAGLDKLKEATNLVAMIKKHDGEGAPLTSVSRVDAHIEAAKLLFSLSQSEQQEYEYSSETIFQLALCCLLATLPVLPKVDLKLANPRLPIETLDYEMCDLDLIDFQDGDLIDLAERIQGQINIQKKEESKIARSQSFGQSPLMQTKIELGHYLVSGSIPVDPKQTSSDTSEDQLALFQFPESLAVDGGLESNASDGVAERWSATSMSAVVAFLASEGEQIPTTSVQSKQAFLSQFSVHSNPEIFKNIGKLCLKSKRYPDLATTAFKEYLSMLTYSKMFTLGAGQSLTDDATVESGFTMIREKAMLWLAQALALNGTTKAGQDGRALLKKVTGGKNTQHLNPLIKMTKAELNRITAAN